MSPARPTSIHQLKVTLKGSKPPIWRRVQVPSTITLFKLHQIIQETMGWWGYHLHEFEIDGMRYGQPDAEDDPFFGWGYDVKSDRTARLHRVAPQAKTRFSYQYDFGDDWQHGILVEKILPPEPGVRYPVCVKGKRACPPEDCGGIWGYMQLLETLADPADSEHDQMMEWVGRPLDPEAFDLDEINRRLEVFREGAKARADRDDRSLRPGAE